jgi:hypothetical protein
MQELDFDYYRRRLRQEQSAAHAAASPAAFAAHRRLADEYAALIGAPEGRGASK